MAETAVKIDLCDICGADIRPDSAFCYNCGGSVSLEEVGLQPAKIVEEQKTEVAQANGNIPKEAAPVGVRNRDRKREARSRAVIERKAVKISWEPRTDSAVPFVVGSIFIVILAAILFFAAYFIK